MNNNNDLFENEFIYNINKQQYIIHKTYITSII